MVYGCDNVEFELAVCGRLENTSVDLDLFDTRTVQLLESRNNAGLLACARRSVNEEVREVTALCLQSADGQY